MRIVEAEATFGKLKGDKLVFAPGFNVFVLPNEGGKSTWCAFIRTMLYGFDTRDRDRGPSKTDPMGHIADKNRFAPWSGEPFYGRMVVEQEGREIELRREGGRAMSRFSARYVVTGASVPGMTGENCGQILCGVSAATFDKTAFIGAGALVSPGAEAGLEAKLAAMASSGDEQVTEKMLESRLNQMKNALRSNSANGALPRALEALERVRAKRVALTRIEGKRTELAAQRLALKGEEERWEKNRENCARYEKNRRRQAKNLAEEQVADARRLAEAAQKEASLPLGMPEEGWIEAGRALVLELKGAERSAQAASDRLEERLSGWTEACDRRDEARRAAEDGTGRAVQTKSAAPWPWFALAIVVLAVGGITFFLSGPLWVLGCGVLLAAGATSMGCRAAVLQKAWTVRREQDRAETARRAAEADQAAVRAEEEERRLTEARLTAKEAVAERDRVSRALQSHLAALGAAASGPEEAERLLSAVAQALGALRKAEAALQAAEARRAGMAVLEEKDEEPEEIVEPAEGTPPCSMEEAEARLRSLRESRAAADRAAAACEGESRAIGDGDALAAEEERLEAQVTALEIRLKAVTLAQETLAEAAGEFRNRVAPPICRRAEELLAQMTGGKYARVELSAGFLASASEKGAPPRPVGALSTGTADQIYLALRLAICELAMASESPPILLDDALLTFDEDRTREAMALLTELAARRQIILFCCKPPLANPS